MKLRLWIMGLAAVMIFGAGIPVKAAPRINRRTSYMTPGRKVKLKITGLGKKRRIRWTSRNKKVAVVSRHGTVTAKKAGKARITARFRYRKKWRRITCVVKVYSMDQKTEALSRGTSLKLDVKGSKKESWKSSNPLVATVSKKGRVKGLKPGNVKITGSIHGIRFTKKIRVGGFTEDVVTIGESSPPAALILKNAGGVPTYTSSNEDVAKTFNNYVVPVSAGTCMIYARADGIIYRCRVTVTRSKATTFVNYLEIYHRFIKRNYTLFERRYDSSIKTFADAKERILAKKVVGITCVVPARWALAAMEIRRADNQSLISGENGSFIKHYTGDVIDNFKLITAARPVGMTLKDAVDRGYLRKGDILAYEGQTHTFVYSGEGYYVYEGGGGCVKDGHYPDGIKMNYATNFYGRNNCIISEVLRWRH